MELDTKVLDDGVVYIRLKGRMDIAGAEQIDTPFALAASNKKADVIVDMSGVDFLASIGMRTLVANAKFQAKKGGRLVMCGPTEPVRQTLVATGIDEIIPIFDGIETARADLQQTPAS